MNFHHDDHLGITLRDFLSNYLPQLKGMSRHTILSYRDSLKLFLQFVAKQNKIPVCKLTLEHIDSDQVISFLDYLEKERGNRVSSRNIRLSAIHSFFHYLAGTFPEYLYQSQRILNIPFKRTSTRIVEYLEFDEIIAVLKSIDQKSFIGRRDYALLLLMFNTGARVQEIVNLKADDIQLLNPFSIRIFGKGRKERICPIWPETAKVLQEYMEECEMDVRKSLPVFLNYQKTLLTRFGIGYILKKYLLIAAKEKPSLAKKRLHPHSIRHSTAVYLLKSGVDFTTIANWLGHASINTTNIYATMDIEMKRQTLSKAKPLTKEDSSQISWKQNPDILAWLESL